MRGYRNRSRPISIHVPARGTTSVGTFSSAAQVFQSTYPHGVRPSQNSGISWKNYFNPRTRTGYDTTSEPFLLYDFISIHVPARGTTELPTRSYRCLRISIHVPARGTTGCDKRPIRYIRISIHVPARGTTLRSAKMVNGLSFQSTYPHGVRRRRAVSVAEWIRFQSTYPHGVRRCCIELALVPF